MSKTLPITHLVRHGQTAWSVSGQHTGLTDLPLTANGELEAAALLPRLAKLTLAKVFTSPLRRAARTCELAGFGGRGEVDHDLLEWDYGDYEGLRSAEIHKLNPEWEIFHDGCPRGESPDQVAARADRVLSRAREAEGDVLMFSSGHILRMMAARWLGLAPASGRLFYLSTAGLSELGYENANARPVMRLWNLASQASGSDRLQPP